MKPRIFISSTFYDLKYIREDLANFVRIHDYEPVLFEDGDIGYTPGENLDTSCYEAMRNSDMVILIIGGEYGSAASGEVKDEFKEYLSYTRNEFRAAIENGIPVFVMIDKKVMAEYGVYDTNYNYIEEEKMPISFNATKNINVFRFIREIKGIVTLPIQEFDKAADIKSFISKQWADMFKTYLSSLRNKNENKKIESSVNEMKNLINRMNVMLDSVGKNVLSKNGSNEYEKVVTQQEILDYCDLISRSFGLSIPDKKDNENYVSMYRKFIRGFLESLRETHHKGLWNQYLNDKVNRKVAHDIFFSLKSYIFDLDFIAYVEAVSNKYELLDSNMDDLVNILSTYKYIERFRKF